CGQVLGNVKRLVDRLARPVGIAKLFQSEEQHAATVLLASAQEFLPFFVRADTENRQWRSLRHRTPSEICLRKSGVRRGAGKRGLYCGLAGREEELQERADALRPRRLVVLASRDFFVM